MIDIIQSQKLISLLDADESEIHKILSMSKTMVITIDISDKFDMLFTAVCNKEELVTMLKQIDGEKLYGVFVADIEDNFTVPS